MTLRDNSAVGNGNCVAYVTGASAIAAGNVARNNPGHGLVVNGETAIMTNNVVAGSGGNGATLNGRGYQVVASGNSFTDNSGWGLYCNSPATVIGNTFARNTSRGLYCSSSGTVMSNSFTANSGNGGGGLRCESHATVAWNTFVGNTSSANGGGAYFTHNGSPSTSVTLSRNVFRQNSAANTGGGLHVEGLAAVFTDNLVVKNSQNSPNFQGAGIWVNTSSNLTMINNTVTDNAATGSGGGLACQLNGTAEVLNVYNNIIWGNSASGNGADVWLAGTGSKKTFRYNNVHGMYGVWDIADNLLDVAPVFFDPVNGDYHLRSTSPCINAGTNGAPSIPAVDLDGNARTNAAIVDLGCYEFNNTAYHPADANQNWAIDATEYANYAAAWKNNQPWPTGQASIPADYVTRAGYLQNQGGTYHNDGAGAPLCWKPGTN